MTPAGVTEKQAHARGAKGDARPYGDVPGSVKAAHKRGLAEYQAADPAPAGESPSQIAPTASNPAAGTQGAGFHPVKTVQDAGSSASEIVLGMVIYSLVLSVIQYGTSGPKLWFEAKFLNKAAPAPTGKDTTPAATATATTTGVLT